jgi:DNA-binding PadR family transcriptional regulator
LEILEDRPGSFPILPKIRRKENLRRPAAYYIHGGYTHDVKTEKDDPRPGPDSLLPLAPAAFHILVALAEEDRHGYAIMEHVASRARGAVRLSAGTLYRTIQRMLEQGLIVETRERPAPEDDDERRRYYRLTSLGAATARAEARRLEGLVRLARASGFAPQKA